MMSNGSHTCGVAVRGIIVASLAIGFALPLSAQSEQRKLAEFAKAIRANQAALRGFSWESRTEIEIDGEPSGVVLAQVRFDAEGSLESTVISRTEADNVGGPIGKRKADKKREKMNQQIAGVKRLIASYIHMSRSTLEKALVNARALPAGEEMTRIQTRGLLHTGDTLSVWVTNRPVELHKFEIFTSYKGEPVQAEAKFRRLSGGPAYPAHTTIDTEMKERKLVLKTENSKPIRR
jgi:hypothetical protein